MKLTHRELEQRDVIEIAGRIQPMQYDSAQVSAKQTKWCKTLRDYGPQVTITSGGKVICCGGLIDFGHTGRAVLWALMANNIKHDFIALYRLGMKLLELHPRRRVEAYIDPHHRAARRMAELAGFRYEGIMQSFESDGANRELWARILL